MDDLRSHVRLEPPPDDDVLLLRGGDDTVQKLRRHAERTHRAFTRPHFAVVLASVETDELARLLACFDPPSQNPRYGHRRRRR